MGGLRRSTIEFLLDGTTNTTVVPLFLLGQQELHLDNMTSSKNSSTASRQRPRCDRCSQTFVDMSKLRRHKREQHAKRKTCPLQDCNYKGTKRMSLLMGQGHHIGHLEKKHGLDREVAIRLVREREEQSLDIFANSADQDVTQYNPSNTSVQPDSPIADMSSLSLSNFADTTTGMPREPMHQVPSMHFQPYQYVSQALTSQATMTYQAPSNVQSSLSFDQLQLSQIVQHDGLPNCINTPFSETNSSIQPLGDFAYEDPEDVHRMRKPYGPY